MAKKTKPDKAEKKSTRKAKQLKHPAEGMSRKRNPDIDRAAEKYRAARDIRMEHTKLEKAAKLSLLETAKKHSVKLYLYESEDGEEFEVEYTEKTDENVSVKKVKADSDGDE